MNRILFLTLLTLILSFFSLTYAEETQEKPENTSPSLTLDVGQKYPLDGVTAQGASINPSSVAEAKIVSGGVLLIGKSPGSATLTLDSSGKKIDIQIRVRPAAPPAPAGTNPQTSSSVALAEIKKIPGITLHQGAGIFSIQGEILGRLNYQKLLYYMRLFPKMFWVPANAAPGIKESLIHQAESLLRSNGFRNLSITNASNRFFLEGNLPGAEEVEMAIELAEKVIPNIENHVPIPVHIDPTVSMRVYILELSRHAHEALGLSWPSEVGSAIQIGPKSGTDRKSVV